ncbi:NUDIX hydrolase [Christiangramia fulva]|uniref:NUDIX hydrolase n=1 Tax=Christiangramia fulva TaxID=2126553 RepID=A0A2R3Z313_9FLAO|nr:NUDIX domain-containing protein [Christiangramia fulva]AVR44644.1 NUDIX hydrolase [Christiangramia fulva]
MTIKKTFISGETDEALEGSVMDSITIDCVIFGFEEGSLEVLLVRHGRGIREGEWGLPGGWIRRDESIDEAAYRLLNDLTGVKNVYLEQLKAFGDPDRFPAGRVITIGYYALVKKEGNRIKAGFTASEARWCKIKEVPGLIYDHNKILNYALEQLQSRVRKEPIGFNLLPSKFTLLQLMQLYEEILGVQMDKPNFRRKFLKMKLLVDQKEKQKDVSHRAAKLYSFDDDVYKRLTQQGFTFEF